MDGLLKPGSFHGKGDWMGKGWSIIRWIVMPVVIDPVLCVVF